MEFLPKLGERENIDSDQHVNAEKFVCEMYGQKKLFSVDEARLEMFLKKYKPKNNKDPISCAKKTDSMFCSHVTETKKE